MEAFPAICRFSSVPKKGEVHAVVSPRMRAGQDPSTSFGISGVLCGLRLIFSLYLQWELSLFSLYKYITFRYLTLNIKKRYILYISKPQIILKIAPAMSYVGHTYNMLR